MNPVSFAYDRFARYMLAPSNLSQEEAVSRALSKTYGMSKSDEQRAQSDLEQIREEPAPRKRAAALKKWASGVVSTESLSKVAATFELSPDEREALRVARPAKKQREALPGTRMTTNNLLVARTGESLLIANILAEGESDESFRIIPTAGLAAYQDALLDAVLSPTDEATMIVEFGQQTLTAADLWLNPPGALSLRVANGGGGRVVSRNQLETAISAVGGVDTRHVQSLGLLMRERDINPDAARGVDERIDAIGAGIDAEIDDLVERLPPFGSSTWEFLVMALRRRDRRAAAHDSEEPSAEGDAG